MPASVRVGQLVGWDVFWREGSILFWLAPIYAMIWEYAYPQSITPYAT